MQKRKGFTLVELVIVIAVIAILAGVLIGTFASVINKANESAKMQEVKAQEIEQKADDILKKIDDSNWYGWEDFEVSIVEKLTKAYKENENSHSSIDTNDIKKIVKEALEEYAKNHANDKTNLTEEQVKAIVENAFGSFKYEGITEAQVRAIVSAASNEIKGTQLTAAQVRTIVNAANANNLTQDDVARIIAQSSLVTTNDITTAVNTLEDALKSEISQSALTKEHVESIIMKLVPVTKEATTVTDFVKFTGDTDDALVSGSTIILSSSLVADLNSEKLILFTSDRKTLYLKSNGFTGKLEINAANADIGLIGDFSGAEVTVEEIAEHSLHIFGKVLSLTIKKGRSVVENGGQVTTLTAIPSIDSTVLVEIKEQAKVENLVAQYQDHGYSEHHRDYIEIENNGKVETAKLTASSALQTSKVTTTNVTIKNGVNARGTDVPQGKVKADETLKNEDSYIATSKLIYVDENGTSNVGVIDDTGVVISETVIEGEARIGTQGYPTLKAALEAAENGDTVVLLKDIQIVQNTANARVPISKSITLDGENRTITTNERGFGVGMTATANIDVIFKDVTIINSQNAGRCIDTRGNLNSLILDNVTLVANGSSGYLQPLTIGGNQSNKVPVLIVDSKIQTVDEANKGYAITTFNPVDMTIINSNIKGWACFNIKAADGSAGSNGSTFVIKDSTLVANNGYSGVSDAYSLVKVEDNNIALSFENSKLSVNGDKNLQSIIAAEDFNLENISLTLKGTTCNLINQSKLWVNFGTSCELRIVGGTYNYDTTVFTYQGVNYLMPNNFDEEFNGYQKTVEGDVTIIRKAID